ncbi:rhomboid family intramembrane serine protease [Crocinitomicaceae bacterium]|nr:rhomboid family intramembrane serine protease [Crocinitomicaceae bacterium]
MFRNLLSNIPDVTKNLLILNLLFFLATIVMQNQGIVLQQELGMHYPSSNLFEPYQLITHFFMHGDLFHLLFNMIGLIVFGSQLERTWGKKRFFVFYFVTAIGAVVLHTIVQGIEIHQLTGEWFPDIINKRLPINKQELIEKWRSAYGIYATSTVGASGAVYGLLMAFALLFPNTQFMLLFPPIPIKAKWLALGLGVIAIYQGFQSNQGDSIAHFAHIGGMLFGFVMIQIWKRDTRNFY